jgi:hypothetical protein
MKVRIENQVICFRISEEEKELLLSGNMLYVYLSYGKGALNSHSYTIMKSKRVDKITLNFINGIFEIFFPESYAKTWDSKKIGFEEIIPIEDAGDLKIIIEMDLKKRKK